MTERSARSGRYCRHIDLKRWLRVVVEFEDDLGHIVTALVQGNPPQDWNP